MKHYTLMNGYYMTIDLQVSLLCSWPAIVSLLACELDMTTGHKLSWLQDLTQLMLYYNELVTSSVVMMIVLVYWGLTSFCNYGNISISFQ